MKNSYISSQAEVASFLRDLKAVINHPSFDPNNDLDILRKKAGESSSDPYTTKNTILALDFDNYDVADELNQLTLREYVETFIDDKQPSSPPFYNFGQIIKGNEVYIKVKIRDRANRKVFCVSFHFAKYPLTGKYPYRR